MTEKESNAPAPADGNEPASPRRDDRPRNSAERAKDNSRDNAEGNSSNPPDEKSKRPWYKRPLIAGGIFILVLALAIGGTFLWLHSRHYETTDDASIDVIPQMVSAQLPGRVVNVAVRDNQEVTADTVLVELDPADYRARAEQARALGEQAAAQAQQALAQRGIFAAQREQALANLTVAETNAENTSREATRLESLRRENVGAVSQQQWDAATAAQRSTAAQVEAAKKAVAAMDAQLNYADSLLKAAQAAQASSAAQLREAELNISYMQIRAKVNGRIANLQVAPGNYVQPGTALMAVVPREVYVTANFKETQLVHMRRGQPVEIQVDAYPDTKLSGHIDSLQPGTGQTFSMLPAENATGNWVKVVQRVPVKISLDHLPDDPDRRLGPGMSVEVKVTVR